MNHVKILNHLRLSRPVYTGNVFCGKSKTRCCLMQRHIVCKHTPSQMYITQTQRNNVVQGRNGEVTRRKCVICLKRFMLGASDAKIIRNLQTYFNWLLDNIANVSFVQYESARSMTLGGNATRYLFDDQLMQKVRINSSVMAKTNAVWKESFNLKKMQCSSR